MLQKVLCGAVITLSSIKASFVLYILQVFQHRAKKHGKFISNFCYDFAVSVFFLPSRFSLRKDNLIHSQRQDNWMHFHSYKENFFIFQF